jgi:hypothetical protein
MSVVTEYFKTRTDGVNLYRTYSDEGKQILQIETGNVYDEAIDVENTRYTYSEYEEPTDDPEDTNPETQDGVEETNIMTRAELTAKVTELDEAMELLLSGVTE